MNEAKSREELERATRVEALLQNPLIDEAFEELEKEFVLAWRSTSIEDSQNREHIYQLLQALEALKGHFQKVLQDGKLAKERLKIIN